MKKNHGFTNYSYICTLIMCNKVKVKLDHKNKLKWKTTNN